MDLLPPSPEKVRLAADTVEAARHASPVLICCALGFQRSATVAIDWLVQAGQATSAREAENLIRAKGWPLRLHAHEVPE